MVHRRMWTTTLTLMCLTWAGLVALSSTRPIGSALTRRSAARAGTIHRCSRNMPPKRTTATAVG